MTPTESPRFRLGVLAIVVVALFAALFVRLWYLQVLTSEPYALEAEANRTAVVQVEAPRGRILDRNGKVLVDNEVTTIVTVDRVVFGDMDDTVVPGEAYIHVDNGAGEDGIADNGIVDGNEIEVGSEAAELVYRLKAEMDRYGSPVEAWELLRRILDVRYTQFAPVPVAEEITDELKIYLDEHAEEFPGVSATRAAIRRYNYGTRAAHLLGFVGAINDKEYDDRVDKPKTYTKTSHIGKDGVERIYEDDLRGIPGQVVYEVDAQRRPVRILEDRSTPPIPGDDVWLSIDVEVQAYSEDLLVQALHDARNRRVGGDNLPNQGSAGAVVVTDPSNGDVLAMASYPTYDPSDFINGISSARYAHLNDDPNKPLTNRVIAGQYAPGSTYKLFTGYGALMDGLRDPESVFMDTGSWTISNCTEGCTRRNAGGTAYGPVNMTSAMKYSSDAYFYSIGEDYWNVRGDLGEEAMQESARAFGLGDLTGIPLPGEVDGRIPSPEQRKAQYDANPGQFLTRDWFTGDNVNMAIGQGDVAVTPLQLVNGYAAFGNHGVQYAPNIAIKVTEGGDRDTVVRDIKPRESRTIDLPPEVYDSLTRGLIGVTREYGGTALGVFQGFPHDAWPVAGKTGTAEVNNKADTALFVAYGPVPAPEYAVAVVLEESGFGGTAAAPVARKLFDVFAGVTPWPTIEPGGSINFVDEQPSQSELAAQGSND